VNSAGFWGGNGIVDPLPIELWIHLLPMIRTSGEAEISQVEMFF
jgi:hypothetical protein